MQLRMRQAQCVGRRAPAQAQCPGLPPQPSRRRRRLAQATRRRPTTRLIMASRRGRGFSVAGLRSGNKRSSSMDNALDDGRSGKKSRKGNGTPRTKNTGAKDGLLDVADVCGWCGCKPKARNLSLAFGGSHMGFHRIGLMCCLYVWPCVFYFSGPYLFFVLVMFLCVSASRNHPRQPCTHRRASGKSTTTPASRSAPCASLTI